MFVVLEVPSWRLDGKDDLVLNGKRLRKLTDMNDLEGAAWLKPFIEASPLLGILNVVSQTARSAAAEPTDEPIWRSIIEFDWTNPDHVYMRVSSPAFSAAFFPFA